MNNKNKKGISAVVATVLIILITVAAITIVWAAIIPMINNQLDQGTLCLDAVSQLSLMDAGYTCVDGNELSLQIKKGATNFELADIQVLISSGGNVESFSLLNDTTTLVPASITLAHLPDANEEKVYRINVADIIAGGTIDSVKIAPVVKVGNTQEICSVSSSKTLLAC
ncbi:hypothetical protein KAI32_00170 [Candidatus Pacearchaeota archaeon]|nr:hypothetical protein [Candidatus Pacearchaeota archaeon]